MKEYETQTSFETHTGKLNNNSSLIWIPISMISGMLMILGFYWLFAKYPVKIVETKTQIVYDITDPFTEEKALDYLIQLHIKYPYVALAQLKLESANGTSDIFKNGNNLFGLKVPRYRATTALGTRNNHAYYSHWRQSILDYAFFCTYSMNQENSSSQDEWVKYLGRNYAQDNSYEKKLIFILSKISIKNDRNIQNN